MSAQARLGRLTHFSRLWAHSKENSGRFLGPEGKKAKGALLGWECLGLRTTFPAVFVNHVIYDRDLSVFSKGELSVLQVQYLFNQ